MEQTNRTILFEEINPEKGDLYTLIGDIKEVRSLTDAQIETINQTLLVQSFDEFLEKFKPKIYGIVDAQNLTFSFSKQKDWENRNVYSIPIQSEKLFFGDIFQLLDVKKNKFVSSDSLQKILFHALDSEEIPQLKKTLHKMRAAFMDGKLKKAEKLLGKIADNFDSGIVLLRLLVEELPSQIERILEPASNPLVIRDTENTQIEVLKMSERFKNHETQIEEARRTAYVDFIEEFLKKRSDENRAVTNVEAMSLCLRIGSFVEEDAGYVIERYNLYQEFFAKILKVFFDFLRPMLQTILGIKAFFNQYEGVKGKKENGMQPSLLIANCAVDSIQIRGNKERLSIYLETVNDKNHSEDAIWYAILPGIAYKKDETHEKVRERFKSTGEVEIQVKNQIEDVESLLNILGEYQVLSFLSIYGKYNTNFRAFAKDGLEDFNDSFRELMHLDKKEYVIPCIPNFTVIPREHMEMILGKRYQYEAFSDEKIIINGEKKLFLEGIYVEAAYVAAGLSAAWQCPEYLNLHFRGSINMELPGTAYRIMDMENRWKTKTAMTREILSYKKDLLEEIEKKSFGVVFVPERRGVTMATDRCMSYQNGSSDCIAAVQTIIYIERIIRHATQDFKSPLIKSFFQNRPGSIKEKWFSNRKAVNAILKESEDLTYELKEAENACVFEVKFKEVSKDRKVPMSN